MAYKLNSKRTFCCVLQVFLRLLTGFLGYRLQEKGRSVCISRSLSDVGYAAQVCIVSCATLTTTLAIALQKISTVLSLRLMDKQQFRSRSQRTATHTVSLHAGDLPGAMASQAATMKVSDLDMFYTVCYVKVSNVFCTGQGCS